MRTPAACQSTARQRWPLIFRLGSRSPRAYGARAAIAKTTDWTIEVTGSATNPAASKSCVLSLLESFPIGGQVVGHASRRENRPSEVRRETARVIPAAEPHSADLRLIVCALVRRGFRRLRSNSEYRER